MIRDTRATRDMFRDTMASRDMSGAVGTHGTYIRH